MSTSIEKAAKIFGRLSEKEDLNKMFSRLQANFEEPSFVLPKNEYSIENHQTRKEILERATQTELSYLSSHDNHPDLDKLPGSIENFIGFTHVPTGIAGPLRVNGSEAKGDFFIPLATTEGTLVASYHRGAKATLLSGGITSVCVAEGVRRSPLFGFANLESGIRFLMWITQVKSGFDAIVAANSKHCKLNDVLLNLEGNNVILTFEYLTGDASGQNMVTICTDAICKFLIENSPIKTNYWYVEGNYSGDKKASAISFTTVRGKKVTAECVVKKQILEDILKITAAAMAQYWTASTFCKWINGFVYGYWSGCSMCFGSSSWGDAYGDLE